MTVEAGLTRYEAVNEIIEKELKSRKKVVVTDVNGQRYIGCALDAGKTVEIHGTPGNDMACYLNGGRVEVFGNCQDAVGNTMNGGEIIVHGHSGDAMGYGMRDGQIYIRDNVACRGGIHMKEFRQMRPVLVIGKNAGSFLGEYMAGGTIVLLGLGLKRGEKLFGTHCASGMHGGKIFVRGSFPKENLSANIKITALTDEDRKELESYVKKYCKYFDGDFDEIMSKPFKKLVPATSRPYANLYTPN
ncbi:MAG: glutamate synthase [Eubacterium sp.]